MKKIAALTACAALLFGLTACEGGESCEWEKEKNKKAKAHAMSLTTVDDGLAERVGGTSGGRGGGSRGGSRGTSGGAGSKPKAPAPKPAAPPPAGYHWEYDCD